MAAAPSCSAAGKLCGSKRRDTGPWCMSAAAAQLLRHLLLLACESKWQGGAVACLGAVLRAAGQAVEAAEAVERRPGRGCNGGGHTRRRAAVSKHVTKPRGARRQHAAAAWHSTVHQAHSCQPTHQWRERAGPKS